VDAQFRAFSLVAGRGLALHAHGLKLMAQKLMA
jgi:hypothetical protein